MRLDDRVLDKPGIRLPRDARLSLRARSAFVSRGGDKLEGALAAFGLEVRGAACADAGASTGGFTDCLLQRGAASVLAIDVGYGQLAWSLRNDPRVTVLERTHIRDLEAPSQRFDLVTADLSFISLQKVLPKLAELTRPGGRLVLLVKPQFELGREDVGSGGVVRDPEKQREAARRVRSAGEALGLSCLAECESALAGPKGNRERFLLLEKPAST